MFVVAWAISYLVWKLGWVEERWGAALAAEDKDLGSKQRR